MSAFWKSKKNRSVMMATRLANDVLRTMVEMARQISDYQRVCC